MVKIPSFKKIDFSPQKKTPFKIILSFPTENMTRNKNSVLIVELDR